MIDSVLLGLFVLFTLGGAVATITMTHPMHVAIGLITAMVGLGAIYGLLGVHVIAVFQIMIYVSAVMVFMVYAIMLLDVRDPSFTGRFSALLWPGLLACTVLAGVLIGAALQGPPAAVAHASTGARFGLQPFSAAFVGEFWLYFELTSVLLVVAVLCAVAVVKIRGRGESHG